jgi:uncharacterized membrane protein
LEPRHRRDPLKRWSHCMSLTPLLNASFAIQLHAFAAIAAFALGLVQFAAPKGTLPHRTFGWVWAALMLIVAISSFWIQGRSPRLAGPWGPIHLLSISVLIILPIALLFAHRHRVRGHAITVISLFIGALMIAGGFAFAPGRIMHAVAFGN